MDPRPAATSEHDREAVDFIRFCYHRRRVGWPELYDEMCAVASRALYQGLCADDLADRGIGFGLFEMPALAALVRDVVAEEQAKRRPVAVMIRSEEPEVEAHAFRIEPTLSEAVPVEPVAIPVAPEPERREPAAPIRFVAVPAGA